MKNTMADQPDTKRQKVEELVYITLQKDGETLEWAYFRDTRIVSNGIALKEDHASLVSTLKTVLDSDGFAVAFEVSNDLLAWFNGALSEDEFDVWGRIKLFAMNYLEIFKKIDPECYEYWSLSQLHSKMYPTSINECKEDCELLSEAFYWLYQQHKCMVN
jgi:hypothetical protein